MMPDTAHLIALGVWFAWLLCVLAVLILAVTPTTDEDTAEPAPREIMVWSDVSVITPHMEGTPVERP